jgi:hypothetical protein
VPRTPRRDDLGWRPTRCGGSFVVTPHRRVRDVLVDGGNPRCLHVRHVTNLIAVQVLVAQWFRAPVDALMC